MKRLLVFILFPNLIFGQYVVPTMPKTNTQPAVQAKASVSINNERDLELSEKSSNILVEFPKDMSQYSKLLIVNALTHEVYYVSGKRYVKFCFDKSLNCNCCGQIEQALSGSSLEVVDPFHKNYKQKRKKEGNNFLKNVKDKAFLYLYLSESRGRGDDINTRVIVRDYQNKIVHRAEYVNAGLGEVFAPFFDF